MPFLIDAATFAARAADAIERGRSFAVIPWPMAWVARLLRVMPDALFDRVFARAPHKPREPAP
jgi:short-subunit dehydrogenase